MIFKYKLICNISSNKFSNHPKELYSKRIESIEYFENSHKSETFQPLFQKVIDVCDNGNEEIVYSMLWQGAAYTPEMAKLAKSAKKENK